MAYIQAASVGADAAPVLFTHSLFQSHTLIEVFGLLPFFYHCQSVVF